MPPLAAILLGIALSTGGTIGLAPGDAAEAEADPPPSDGEPADTPDDGSGTGSPLAGAIGLAALAAAMAAAQRSSGGLSPASGLGLTPGTDPLVVFVPGHSQPQGDRAFADLVGLMDLDDDDVRHFDYRWVDGGPDHGDASEDVGIDDAASALNAYLAGVAGDDRPIYLVGFSKGGATVAELVADWDEGRWGPSRAVVGAALLDPPMARGPHGFLQSVGRHVGSFPDDGGYQPVQCQFLRFDCEDRRAHLGESSSVEVVVIRNPRAAITSFDDVPPGLRVYDAADDGPGPLGQLVRNPFALVGRVVAAHESVLSDPRVAQCLVAEWRPGADCDLPRRGAGPRLAGLGGGATGSPGLQKVL